MRSSEGSIGSVNILLDKLETTTTTAFRPPEARASRMAFPRTMVSDRLAYMLLETMVEGILLFGLRSESAVIDPVSIGKAS